MDLAKMMESPGHRRWHDAAYWVVLLAACVVMYVMNTLTPFKEDDMAYSVIPSGSLREFCSSLVDHFMTTNGRFADVVANLFCAVLSKPVFNVCNALVFGLMAHLVALLSAGRRSLMALTLFLAVVGVCYPVPGETMLWVAGSCNYLWAVTASLALIYYLLNHKDGPLGWGRAVLLLLGAFIAGNFNEATSFGVFAGLFLYYAFNRRKVDRRVVIAMVGYLLGVAMIVASPGAWSRMAEGSGEAHSGFIGLLSSHWYIFNEKMWRFYTPLTACAAGLVVLLSKGFGMVRTMPYPGFPTDSQAAFVAMLCASDGTSMIVENIFESRFKYIAQLNKMGADIRVEGRIAVIQGVERLHGAAVESPDLRGGSALVTAALGAQGVSRVTGVQYIDRGYENFEGVLSSLGAVIERK